jgi:hypothetical protein
MARATGLFLPHNGVARFQADKITIACRLSTTISGRSRDADGGESAVLRLPSTRDQPQQVVPEICVDAI